jgi:hypothetical protein
MVDGTAAGLLEVKDNPKPRRLWQGKGSGSCAASLILLRISALLYGEKARLRNCFVGKQGKTRPFWQCGSRNSAR